MKSLLICPAERISVAQLSLHLPLVTLPFCGKPFLFYWIEALLAQGVRHLVILATDRPEVVRETVGDGSRWGLEIEVIPERRELSVAEAKSKYQAFSFDGGIHLADHLPGSVSKSFESYESFFRTATDVLEAPVSPDRIGLKELRPGIWVGLHCRIPATAKLNAPCWIGDRVSIGEGVEIGPSAVVESRSIVEAGASISHSVIFPETFIGPETEITRSIVAGTDLINWQHNSVISVSDPFLLDSLRDTAPRLSFTQLFGRLAAFFCLAATAPLAFLWTLVSHFRGETVLQERRAVDPTSRVPVETILYYEFANCSGLWQRWPQLWNVALGEFSWVGNRPLSPVEAAQLTTDFEKLWLKGRIGLISHADAEGCFDRFTDEVKVHASFYSVHASTSTDLEILKKVIVGCGKRNVSAGIPLNRTLLEEEKVALRKSVLR